MKKTIYLLLACMFLSVLAVAQNTKLKNKPDLIFVIKNKKTGKEIVTNFPAVSASDIISYDDMDTTAAAKRFGKEWASKVMVFTFNDSVRLTTFTEFCKKHKLNSKLPIVLVDAMFRSFYSDTTARNVLLDASRVTSFEQKRDSIFIHMNLNKKN